LLCQGAGGDQDGSGYGAAVMTAGVNRQSPMLLKKKVARVIGASEKFSIYKYF